MVWAYILAEIHLLDTFHPTIRPTLDTMLAADLLQRSQAHPQFSCNFFGRHLNRQSNMNSRQKHKWLVFVKQAHRHEQEATQHTPPSHLLKDSMPRAQRMKSLVNQGTKSQL